MEKQALQRDRLLEQARETATSPGVYLMKDSEGKILYVGKAKNLRNRVSTYFQPAGNDSSRIEMMVRQVEWFEVILTETETEALILECTLIKKHKPRFNVMLKDDKAYPYIKVQFETPYPRLEWTRRVQRDGARYFGPFPSAWAARQVMQMLTQTLKLRDCSDNTFKHRSRPCILYQMQLCSAPCVGKISELDYRETLQQAIRVLEGQGDTLLEQLERGMRDAAHHEEFEAAAQYRDQIQNLKVVMETQGVVEAGSDRDRDVVAIAAEGDAGHGCVLCIRGGRLVSVQHYTLQNSSQSAADDGSALLFDFLAQYYLGTGARKGMEVTHPKEILVPIAPADPELLEKTLSVSLRVPETKEEQQLVNVAVLNAKHALELRSKKEGGHDVRVLEEIQQKLHLERPPVRIECYDVSNIHGEDAVASRVVFVNAAPEKNLYRRYKIRTVEGSNDFAMMKEVLGRRFQNREDPFPDLVVVDGGKGQLAQAVAILEELQVQGVFVAGLAKARTERNFRSPEVKGSDERVFIPGRKNPVPLYPTSGAYRLLTHVRDEAHRFAVSYHRHLRDKRSLKSD